MNNTVNEEVYLSEKKNIYRSKYPNEEFTPFHGIIDSINNDFWKKKEYYVNEIDISLKNIKEKRYLKFNIIKIIYFLSKIYNIDKTQNKTGTIDYANDVVREICKDNYGLFRNEYKKISLTYRYKYEDMCQNSNPPPKILVISYDEDKKRFFIYQGNYMFKGSKEEALSQDLYLNKIYEKIKQFRPDLVVCCTQNSLSCTEDHFQHYLKNPIKKLNYLLISKADATTEYDSGYLSCPIKISNTSKPYNVRTRIYRNTNTLDANLGTKNFNTKSVSGNFNKKSKYDEWYTIRSGKPPINKFYVEHIGFRRITESIDGIGGILFDIKICKKSDETSIPTCFQNIFCNYNLGSSSSTRILNGMATNSMFEKSKINSTLENELQIFMITPNTVKTRKIFKGDEENILINNNTKENNSTRRKRIIGKNNGTTKFKKINTTKIINNVIQEEYEAIKGNNKILKKIKMFNIIET
jgi:hypothetical protein